MHYRGMSAFSNGVWGGGGGGGGRESGRYNFEEMNDKSLRIVSVKKYDISSI